MESIVLQELLVLSWEESTLWELHWAVNAMFPEEEVSKNLARAIEVTSWLRDTKRIKFFSENLEKEKIIKEDKETLFRHDTWKPEKWSDAILVATTNLGDDFYASFEKKFWTNISKAGFSRRAKQYTLSSRALDALKIHQFRHIIRTLGIPPVTIRPGFLNHIDSFSKTQCIVNSKTNIITDISHIDNSPQLS